MSSSCSSCTCSCTQLWGWPGVWKPMTYLIFFFFTACVVDVLSALFYNTSDSAVGHHDFSLSHFVRQSRQRLGLEDSKRQANRHSTSDPLTADKRKTTGAIGRTSKQCKERIKTEMSILPRRLSCRWIGLNPPAGTLERQWDRRYCCYASRQTLTSSSDSVLCLMRIARARFLSNTRHCPMVTSKFVCPTTMPGWRSGPQLDREEGNTVVCYPQLCFRADCATDSRVQGSL